MQRTSRDLLVASGLVLGLPALAHGQYTNDSTTGGLYHFDSTYEDGTPS